MADNNLDIHPIKAPRLNQPGYGRGIDEQFKNINENFKILGNRDFVKGDRGFSVRTHNIPLCLYGHIENSNNGGRIFSHAAASESNFTKYLTQEGINILSAILQSHVIYNDNNSDFNTVKTQFSNFAHRNISYTNDNGVEDYICLYEFDDVRDHFLDYFPSCADIETVSGIYSILSGFQDGDSITLIEEYDPVATVKEYKPICSINKFVMIDTRFASQAISSTDLSDYSNLIDISCSVHMVSLQSTESNDIISGVYEVLHDMPSLYYDTNSKVFCWKIGSQKTGIIAQGPQGKNGETSKFHILRVEKHNDDTTDLTIDEIKEKKSEYNENSNLWHTWQRGHGLFTEQRAWYTISSYLADSVDIDEENHEGNIKGVAWIPVEGQLTTDGKRVGSFGNTVTPKSGDSCMVFIDQYVENTGEETDKIVTLVFFSSLKIEENTAEEKNKYKCILTTDNMLSSTIGAKEIEDILTNNISSSSPLRGLHVPCSYDNKGLGYRHLIYSTSDSSNSTVNSNNLARVLHISPVYYGYILNQTTDNGNRLCNTASLRIDYNDVVMGCNPTTQESDYARISIKNGTLKAGTTNAYIKLNKDKTGDSVIPATIPGLEIYLTDGKNTNQFSIYEKIINNYKYWEFASENSPLLITAGTDIQQVDNGYAGGKLCIGDVKEEKLNNHIRIDGKSIQAFKLGDDGKISVADLYLNDTGAQVHINSLVAKSFTCQQNAGINGSLTVQKDATVRGGLTSSYLTVEGYSNEGQSRNIVQIDSLGNILLNPQHQKAIYKDINNRDVDVYKAWMRGPNTEFHLDMRHMAIASFGQFLKEDAQQYPKYNGNLSLLGGNIYIGSRGTYKDENGKSYLMDLPRIFMQGRTYCQNGFVLWGGNKSVLDFKTTGCYYPAKVTPPYKLEGTSNSFKTESTGLIYITPDMVDNSSRITIYVNRHWQDIKNGYGIRKTGGDRDLIVSLKGFEPGTLLHLTVIAFYGNIESNSYEMNVQIGDSGYVCNRQAGNVIYDGGRLIYKAEGPGERGTGKVVHNGLTYYINRFVFRGLIYVNHNNHLSNDANYKNCGDAITILGDQCWYDRDTNALI